MESRDHLRELLKGRNSGGVFLTTIHKFTEDTELLTERTNVICIFDEAHRSQVNLEQKLKVNLIILLAENDYPPVDRDEVYNEFFDQAQNFKKNQAA